MDVDMDASYSGLISPAHRALSIQEISLLVCSFFRVGSYPDYDSLFNTAVTCKVLCKPALSVLWYDIQGFSTLIMLLPQDCWEDKGVAVGYQTGVQYVMKREPTLEECSRVALYASLIRKFAYKSDEDMGVDVGFLRAFNALFPPPSFFPGVRTLEWQVKDTDGFQHLNIFLGPQLESLNVEFYPFDQARLTVFPLLENCSNLRDVALTGTDAHDNVAALCEMVTKWKYLTAIEVEAINTDTFIYLSSLPAFTSLRLTSVDAIDWDQVASSINPETAFPNLDVFDVNNIDVDIASRFLRLTKFKLSKLSLLLTKSNTGLAWHSLVNVIKEQCNAEKLTTLAIEDPSDEEDLTEEQLEPSMILDDTLDILFTFKNLTDVVLVSTYGFIADDAMMLKFAQFLPGLKRFSLLTGRIYDPTLPRVTLHALLSFARHSPCLESLGLVFNAEGVQLPHHASSHSEQLICPLSKLTVGHSPIQNAVSVAGILSDWFPKLLTIQCYDPQLGGDFDTVRAARWARVRQLVAVLQQVRAQERRSGITEEDTSHRFNSEANTA